MGFKLSIILGILLITTSAGSFFYIKYLSDQITTLKANQMVLEGEIHKQNESIKQYLENQKVRDEQIAGLEQEKQESQREVQKLRATFARHNMDNLALTKPGLIEKAVNRGTQRVFDELVSITNPNQFDEKPPTN